MRREARSVAGVAKKEAKREALREALREVSWREAWRAERSNLVPVSADCSLCPQWFAMTEIGLSRFAHTTFASPDITFLQPQQKLWIFSRT
jgi:hypothetical protein